MLFRYIPPSNFLISDIPVPQTFPLVFRRFVGFASEPGVIGLTISNIYFGAVCTLIIIIPMCISKCAF